MNEDEKIEWMARNNATFSHFVGEKEVWESPNFTIVWHNGLKGMSKGALTEEEEKNIFGR